MVVSLFHRSGSLSRGLRRKAASKRNRTADDRRMRLAIDQLESRLALAITTPLSIGDVTVGSFSDTPTGPGLVGDYVTVSIEGTRGTVIFNGGTGVADGGFIDSIQILNPSPDFQLTIGAEVRTSNNGTPGFVPYGSDGIVQLGQITAPSTIRGINTIRGPFTNVAVTTSPPFGFTQTTPGSTTILVEGDQTGTFSAGTFVCTTPLVSTGTVGAPSFASITTSSFDAGTNLTTLVLDAATAAGTTGGGLTLAQASLQPRFDLTSFVGTSFTNISDKANGGLFVDRVLGADTTVNGVNYPDLGILLSQGLVQYASIGIRDSLDAAVVLGTANSATVAGRMFVQSATEDSELFVGPRTASVAMNSNFQLTTGAAPFGSRVVVSQQFDGLMNLGGAATGSWLFNRGIGANSVLNASRWNGQTGAEPVGLTVLGNFAGKLNSTTDDITLDVRGSLLPTARVNSSSALDLTVGGSVQKGAVASAYSGIAFDIAGDLLGTIQAGEDLDGTVGGNVTNATINTSGDLTLSVLGNVTNSKIVADNDFTLNVAKSITGSTLQSSESDMTVNVAGSVTNSTLVVGETNDLTLNVGGNLTGSALRVSDNILANVKGSVSKTQFISTTGEVTVNVGGDITNSKLLAPGGVTLNAARDALGVTVAGGYDPVSLAVGRNFSGTVQSGTGDVLVAVGGSVLKGSAIAGGRVLVDIARNFDASVTAGRLRFFVGGNVSQASRITAQTVTDWQDVGGQNFRIGGRFDGIVNVVTFDAAPNVDTVTVIGGGAGSSARFYVTRFFTDTLIFGGNFLGNLRVLQDLEASLDFRGNVDRITVGGRIGTYISGNTPLVYPVSINVAGRLKQLNSNSYFQAAVKGRNGTFYNDATSTSGFPSLAATGILTTGSYVTVVPTRPAVQPGPGPTPPQTYTVPSVPLAFSAASRNGPAGILVSFTNATNNGNLPIVFYEYSTNATAGTPTWRRFDNPAQTGASNIVLTVDSAGGAFTPGNTYQVAVRAVNAIGSTATAPSSVLVVVPPSAPASFSATVVGVGIQVDFTAPTSTGGGTITYQYTTDNGANWRNFTNPSQGPGTNIALPGPSAGGTFSSPSGPYQVTVRATNSAGSTAYSPVTTLSIP